MLPSMMTKLIPVYNGNGSLNTKSVELACDLVTRGGVLGVPTDTIYGLMGLAQKPSVISRIYSIKGRSNTNPLVICLPSVDDISKWALIKSSQPSTQQLNLLLSTLLPGPFTVILDRSPSLNPFLNPDKTSIGIRIPDHPFIMSIATTIGQPLALTSANISGQPSSRSVDEFHSLWPSLDAIFDGGQLNDDPHKLGSTIIDLSTEGYYKITRPGCALDRAKTILENQFNLKQLKQESTN